MPTRVPTRRADRRIQEFTKRINTAPTERSLVFAAVGWLMAEYYKIPPARRPHWIGRWKALAQEMNKETRNDSQ
jgi:hypothetical protein